ncbi:MAG: AAA family ATPase [Acidobacteria bacterium]|nr:AAA family ATPase [Acidobacteriota bacterium]
MTTDPLDGSLARRVPISLRALVDASLPPLDYVLPGMLAGTVGALISPGGVGKSWWALQASVYLAGGPDILGLDDPRARQLRPGPVVYLAAEDPELPLLYRLQALARMMDDATLDRVDRNLHVIPLLGESLDVMTPPYRQALTHYAKGTRLIVIDTLRRAHTLDENSSGDMARLLAVLDQVAVTSNSGVLYLHHTTKSAALSGQGDLQQAARGSSVLVDNIRWQAYVSGMSEAEADRYGITDEDRRLYVRAGVAKINYGAPLPERWYRRDERGILRPADLRPIATRTRRTRQEALSV